jgi:hypothetical protein
MATRKISSNVPAATRLGLLVLIGAAALVVPSHLSDPVRKIRAAEPELVACLADSCPGVLHERRVARLENHLFARMPGLDPALHEDLARAILAEAEAARIDPLLVLAVIQIESGYDPSVVSSAGALGLMQLLPATLQREVKGAGMDAGDPHGPVANVRAGVRYLVRCLHSYPDHDVALMAYNAGPNRLYGWLRAGAVPSQVRGYARRVLAERDRLHRTIPGESGPQLAEFRPLRG